MSCPFRTRFSSITYSSTAAWRLTIQQTHLMRRLVASPPKAAQTWILGPDLQHAREGFAATSVNGKALFAGGADGTGFWATVEVYDSATETWSVSPSALSVARARLGATSVGDLAIFAGGLDASFISSRILFISPSQPTRLLS